jgi:hypothetical protein
MEAKEILKEKWKPISQGLITIIILVLIISWLGLNWWQIIITIVGFQVLMQLYMVFKKGQKFSFKRLLLGAAKVSVLVSLITLFSTWGFIGIFGILCFIALWKIFWNWGQFLQGKQMIEKMVWGKPLKDFKTGKDIPKIRIGKNKGGE